jgi:hypothetical protein
VRRLPRANRQIIMLLSVQEILGEAHVQKM